MTKEINQIKTNIVCPVCNKAISDIWLAKLDSVIGLRYAYICSNCENLLKLSKERINELSVDTLLSGTILPAS